MTGKEVPWDKVVKAYEYYEGNYVVIKESKLEKIAPKHVYSIEIQGFVPAANVESIYFEKPYYITPNKVGRKVTFYYERF